MWWVNFFTNVFEAWLGFFMAYRFCAGQVVSPLTVANPGYGKGVLGVGGMIWMLQCSRRGHLPRFCILVLNFSLKCLKISQINLKSCLYKNISAYCPAMFFLLKCLWQLFMEFRRNKKIQKWQIWKNILTIISCFLFMRLSWRCSQYAIGKF